MSHGGPGRIACVEIKRLTKQLYTAILQDPWVLVYVVRINGSLCEQLFVGFCGGLLLHPLFQVLPMLLPRSYHPVYHSPGTELSTTSVVSRSSHDLLDSSDCVACCLTAL